MFTCSLLFTAEGGRELVSHAGGACVRMRSHVQRIARLLLAMSDCWRSCGNCLAICANTAFTHSTSLWTGLLKSCPSVKTDRWRRAWILSVRVCTRLCNFTSLHGKLIFSLNPRNWKRLQGKQFETVFNPVCVCVCACWSREVYADQRSLFVVVVFIVVQTSVYLAVWQLQNTVLKFKLD